MNLRRYLYYIYFISILFLNTRYVKYLSNGIKNIGFMGYSLQEKTATCKTNPLDEGQEEQTDIQRESDHLLPWQNLQILLGASLCIQTHPNRASAEPLV